MIFAHTYKLIAEGKKTQTRRITKPEQYPLKDMDTRLILAITTLDAPITEVDKYDGRLVYKVDGNQYKYLPAVYQVGKEYAVQYGRGKPTVWWRERDGVIQYAHEISDSNMTLLYPMSDYGTLNGNAIDLRDWGYQPLRIRITEIGREDVRKISEADIEAEGFSDPFYFMETWIGMHDKSYLKTFLYANDMGSLTEYGFYDRPAERYDAWKISFELVKEAK